MKRLIGLTLLMVMCFGCVTAHAVPAEPTDLSAVPIEKQLLPDELWPSAVSINAIQSFNCVSLDPATFIVEMRKARTQARTREYLEVMGMQLPYVGAIENVLLNGEYEIVLNKEIWLDGTWQHLMVVGAIERNLGEAKKEQPRAAVLFLYSEEEGWQLLDCIYDLYAEGIELVETDMGEPNAQNAYLEITTAGLRTSSILREVDSDVVKWYYDLATRQIHLVYYESKKSRTQCDMPNRPRHISYHASYVIQSQKVLRDNGENGLIRTISYIINKSEGVYSETMLCQCTLQLLKLDPETGAYMDTGKQKQYEGTLAERILDLNETAKLAMLE